MLDVFCQCHVTGIFGIMAQKWTMADLYFLSYANTRRNNVKRAQASVLSTQETSASLDSTQWSMTGNSGRKQMMSSRGHELVLNLWWQEHMVPPPPPAPNPLIHTDQWFIFKLRMCHWISLFISAKLCVWRTHTWGFSKCLVWFYSESAWNEITFKFLSGSC